MQTLLNPSKLQFSTLLEVQLSLIFKDPNLA